MCVLKPFLAFWEYDCFQKNCIPQESSGHIFTNGSASESNSKPFSLAKGLLSTGLCYSWPLFLIITTNSSVRFTTLHANLIEQTTSSIELEVLKRRIIVVIRNDSRCLLLHRLEQHRSILLSKETYRTLAQPAGPCGNHFGDMISKIPNTTLNGQPHLKWQSCLPCDVLFVADIVWACKCTRKLVEDWHVNQSGCNIWIRWLCI